MEDSLDRLIRNHVHISCPSRDEILRAARPVVIKQVVEMFNTMEVRDQWVNVPQPVRQIIEQLRQEAEK